MGQENFVIGIDTGGTFTDVVGMAENGEIYIAKAATTPKDFALGVMNAIAALPEVIGLSVSELLSRCTMIKHGTTITTNALINRVGSKARLITTKGFEDTTLVKEENGSLGSELYVNALATE